MSKELIGSHSVHETLVRQTQIDAARIEELERELECERIRLAACGVVALANTPESAAKAREMLPKYRSASCNDVARIVDSEMALRQERDALQADNARLWGALNTQLNDCINFNGGQLTICIMEASTAALAATHEQSLAAYRNKVIEDCAVLCEKSDRYRGAYFAEKLRAMKEQP